MLEIELPVGFEVGVDGQEPQGMPFTPVPLEPGKHTLVVHTACQQLEVEVDAPAHETTRVDRSRVAGLELGTLEVTARDLEGKSLAHAVMIDDKLIGGGEGTSTSVVPACKYRVKVVSEGLGGFIEDIEFGKEAKVERDVVLAPGPDMVRIHGGPFTLGPPASSLKTEGRWDLTYPTKDVDLSTFDVDKTEVTAAQYQECRISGRCSWDVGVVGYPTFPSINEEYCTTTLGFELRIPLPGLEDHPMNCVSYDEAKMYCAAVGKRLPTVAEWEFAGRSRNREYYCPWRPPADVATDNPTCGRGRKRSSKTHAVCSFPDESTEQGLCDMASNVTEFVTDERMAWRLESDVPTRGGWNDEPAITMLDKPLPYNIRVKYDPTTDEQNIHVGFRCVRDVRDTNH